MAALQVVLGQPGLESERPALRAVIKVALLNQEPAGKPITLEGVFVGGSAGSAEGKLMQVMKLPTNQRDSPRGILDRVTRVQEGTCLLFCCCGLYIIQHSESCLDPF
uniref:Uncharacterized protein n=1 Tax=Labrus bergylta TaxID=56723 RepID=A0A3Q3FTQ1_9LABR